jgi:hypothetical protein
LNLNSKKVFQVTSVRNGAFDPFYSTNNQTISFSNYTSHGYDIAVAGFDTTSLIPVEKIIKFSNGIAEIISSQETKKFNPKEIPNQHYTSRPYSKIGHLINVHSWVPLYANTSGLSGRNDNILPGFLLISQNLQGTMVATGGLGFSRNQVHSSATLAYKALYPIFEISASGGDSAVYADKKMKNINNAKGLRYLAKMYVPLNLTRNEFLFYIQPSIEASFDNVHYIEPASNHERSGITRFGYSIDVYKYQNLSKRDLMPNFGVALTVYFSHPGKAQYNVAGDYLMLQSNLYLPGFFNHQGLKLSFGIEQQDIKPFAISSNLTIPRGYRKIWGSFNNNFSEIRILAADYIFPIAYPDYNLAGFIYIKRLVGKIYIENTNTELRYPLEANAPKTNYTTSGAEFTADFHIFYLPSPYIFKIGMRYSYRFDTGGWVPEYIINLADYF